MNLVSVASREETKEGKLWPGRLLPWKCRNLPSLEVLSHRCDVLLRGKFGTRSLLSQIFWWGNNYPGYLWRIKISGSWSHWIRISKGVSWEVVFSLVPRWCISSEKDGKHWPTFMLHPVAWGSAVGTWAVAHLLGACCKCRILGPVADFLSQKWHWTRSCAQYSLRSTDLDDS